MFLQKIPDLDSKVAIVTGANTGLGYATAVTLAAHGAHVFLACRSQEKAMEAIKRAKAEIQKDYPTLRAASNPKLEFLELDLNDLKKTRNAAHEFLAKGLPLHILVNNSGIAGSPFELNEAGIEKVFAVNHLGPFLFTMELLNRIKESQPSRIVNVSSFAAEFVSGVDIETLNDSTSAINTGSNMMRYGRSKLCNILFTKALARRVKDENVYVNASHPGIVRTEIGRRSEEHYGPNLSRVMELLTGIVFYTPKEGCLTQVYCATSPEIENRDVRGKYFIPIANELRPNPASEDVEAQEALWTYSEKLVQEKAPA
ncbi:hypothetical protein BGZ52_001527 [Haplosporangium bisporale]|nr:hypothetical protein BGZ52_001527 [Haplosporangium bisporale]